MNGTKPPMSINRERLIQAFFFVTFGFLLYQLFVLARPFFPGLFGACLLALAFYPFYVRVKRRTRNPSVAAFTLTVCVILLAVLPTIYTVVIVMDEAGKLAPTIQASITAVREGDLQSIADNLPPSLRYLVEGKIASLRNVGLDLEPFIISQLKMFGAWMISIGTLTAKKILLTFLNGLILIITLFFAFRDGDRFFAWLLSLIPMQDAHKRDIARRAYETFRAVAVGVGVTALVQGFVAMIGYGLAGVKFPVLMGLLTTVCALLGASILITLPVALSIWSQSTGWGIFLLIWGLGIVGTLDNFLRPILIGTRARMPFFLILFSIIGGIKAYGFIGIIVGPVLVASIMTFIKIYREEYGQ